ncbi:TetR/AcrR family transcriptional regulator [Streptomyces sp. NPDC048172]|uniref:TetR/AcrR family transcriptional regulator n=1 Tax=Streptomyces sp. NPDC048172 TaxID=3365505 RepID=UPI0037131B09
MSEEHEDDGLRERLVRAGVELVALEGAQALSLREIARRAGVSHGAPRRWFPTHLALLSAVAREGFTALGAELRAADSAGAPRARLLALSRVYLDFARRRPGMYELMFRHDLLESEHLGLRRTSLPLFDELVSLLPPSGDGDPKIVAGAFWANLHGIAQLWSRGALQLATDTDEVEPLLRATLEAHAPGSAPE